MGAVYLWYVEVYYYDEDEWNYKTASYGVWHRVKKYDRTFKNKLNALDYAASIRRKNYWHANVIKWYGN